ncbi:hypothetical protein [Niallia oryzisoli]|uniref:hypothetical protein n=1 Tax=Niallia oryzisoli TaxID=1737571 RepID=UPI0037368556
MSLDIIQEYKNVLFPKDIVSMFADIVEQDKVMLNVFSYITQKSQGEGKDFNGVTVNDISKEVKIERPVKIVKGKQVHFENQVTYIHRQAAGRIVDKLLTMSLLSCKPLTPYKYYFITKRGIQIMHEIIERQGKLGDEKNG